MFTITSITPEAVVTDKGTFMNRFFLFPANVLEVGKTYVFELIGKKIISAKEYP